MNRQEHTHIHHTRSAQMHDCTKITSSAEVKNNKVNRGKKLPGSSAGTFLTKDHPQQTLDKFFPKYSVF